MKTPNSSALKGNLKTFVASGGVLTGAAVGSQGAIIHTDISDITIGPGGSSGIFFSLTGQDADTVQENVNGGAQFVLNFYNNNSDKPRIQGIGASGVTAAYFAPGPGLYFASQLSSSTPINSGLSFYSGPYTFLAYFGDGPWDPGERAFLGLRINSGGDRFGWADVTYQADESLTLHAFAYEDSGAQILAGAVPEPATTGAIAAVFAGAVGAFELRRRRKAVRCSEGK